ncbi:endonuclease/exonuclease/phosphatase family protein [Tamlana sp. 2_MG-2023]|uniref:endonuclease/exonuclease/phosphatase family protein n=1 Tax=unclassified Tamlana TaxID=2614803 RepID=UPI0026E345A0|nr:MULTISPECIES: endonuclease/exonuclease/phosphatase family protein [unclassified Tamlana]MDO6760524.1 endonuclease/exonuclease/phosphatase family protein [Tamlana sp. 2_MG-2023]MDO6790780.1 endonuclease/exonuclease/phosphatase family protein [Tamlana sp. 1_MG-2023]
MPYSKFIIYLLVFAYFNVGQAQEKQFKIHTLAFYNLENLFDTINDPNKFDEYSPMMEIKTQRKKAYEQKLVNMAKVLVDIGKDFTKQPPALIGICEIENAAVLDDLIMEPSLREYAFKYVHFDSPDMRGIDVALLYRTTLFAPSHWTTHELKIYEDDKQIYTRDQLLVSGKLENENIHVLVNHWPSRRGGASKSNHKRMAAAKLNKRIVDSLQVIDPYAKVFIMGDLNDNPNNASVKKVLKAKSEKNKVNLKGIYNPYINIYKSGLGTTAYRDAWSLFDQIMFTKPLLEKDYTSFQYYKAGIYNKNYIIQQSGTYKGYPYRSWNYSGFSNGFSDHFPVYVYLIKEIQ